MQQQKGHIKTAKRAVDSASEHKTKLRDIKAFFIRLLKIEESDTRALSGWLMGRKAEHGLRGQWPFPSLLTWIHKST